MGHVFGERLPGIAYIERPGAYALILDDARRVPIVKLGEDRYYLPGGGLEAGETPEHCLIREVAEELAHEALIGEPLGRAVQYLESIRFGHIIVEAHYFRVTLGGALARDPEHEALWLPSVEAARLLTREADRWALGTLLGGGGQV